MAGIWALFWALSNVIFKDVAPLPIRPRSEEVDNVELSTINAADQAQNTVSGTCPTTSHFASTMGGDHMHVLLCDDMLFYPR